MSTTATITRNSNGQGRTVPHNLQAEESTLGAMLLSRDAIAEVVPLIEAGDFYKPTHGHVFAAVAALYEEGAPVDPTTVADRLGRDGLLEGIGGPATLVSLQAATPATTNAARYARIVSDHAWLRRAIGVVGKVLDGAYDLPDDVEEFRDWVEAEVFGLRRETDGRRASTIGSSIRAWVDRLEAKAFHDELPGVPTGWTDLDEYLLGLHPAQLVTLAGRPGMGKSSAAATLSANVAAHTGAPVLFVSIEMSRAELEDRFMATASQVELQKIRRGRLSEKDWGRINVAIGQVGDLPLYLLDSPVATLLSVRAEARRVAAANRGALGLVVVDYLQLMSTSSRAENRQVEVAELARGLKRLAGELGVPVLALAQLNRQLETRREKRPTLADLRESGEIENSSDVVLFVYRDEVYNEGSPDRGVAEVIVAKQRNGPLGVARLAYDGRFGTWKNMARAI